MKHSHEARNTTHQCGTLVFGHDPRTSVLDPYCRAHDVANLYVVDASFFPSSAAVNPGLTIIAQALRVADHITKAPSPAVHDQGRLQDNPHESHVVQSRRHHRVGLQPVRAVLLGGVRLSAGRRRRHAAGARAVVLRTSTGRRRAARSAGFVCPAAPCSRSSISSRSSRRSTCPGTASARRTSRSTCATFSEVVRRPADAAASSASAEPERSPRGHSFFFARDFDGNLIELMDLGYMYHVLGWLGPLGGGCSDAACTSSTIR